MTAPVTKPQARAIIEALIAQYNTLDKEAVASMSETDVTNKFITPLFEALGWPTKSQQYEQEVFTQAGRPDIRAEFRPKTYLYVEAKRFGKIDKLARNTLSGVLTPGQMMLPGMATDRTKEEQQAINYAFANHGEWAILTNFERFRLFNARRDWLVFSIEKPEGYLEADFEYLWQLAWHNIQNGSLDNLNNQRARADVDSNYLNFINEWRLRLARDIVERQTKNWWAFDENGEINLPRLRSVVQRILDRLVVVRYAEDHLIAPAGTLWQMLELTRTNPYVFRFGEQLRHLYRGFDRDHNSALFALGDADKADFSDDVLDGLVSKLYEARFRAMTPDIMGNTYEQYLGKALAFDAGEINTRDNLETRKKQGSYYTPQVIVRYIVDHSLGRYLEGKRWDEIADLRVIDPACGSGSFLIYAYEVLANYYRGEIRRIEAEEAARLDELVTQGMTAPIDLRIELTPFRAAREKLAHYPRIILERHLYGVDLDPQAAEIATVNLIMRAMVDQRGTEKRLPLILNQNVKVGNALIGSHDYLPDHAQQLAELRRLRLQLVDQPHDHDALLAEVDALEASLNATLNAPIAEHFTDIDDWERAIRPFHWAVGFPELFVDQQGASLGATAGFTVVIGNPPWEIIQPDLREYYAQFDPLIESKYSRRKVEARVKELNSLNSRIETDYVQQVTRIKSTANYFKKTIDYTFQGKGKSATHNLFTERCYSLLISKGFLGLVIPSGIYTDMGTKDLREMLLTEGCIDFLFNFSNERFFFPHVHHSVKFSLLGAQKGISSEGFYATFRFNPRVAVSPDDLASFLSNSDNLIFIHEKSVERFSPKTLSVMEFQTQKDYDIANKIYADHATLGNKTESEWHVSFSQEMNMTSCRHLFLTQPTPTPLFEGKTVHQFTTSYAEPRYWLNEIDLKNTHYRIALRAIARTTDARTLIASMLPAKAGAGHSLLVTKHPLPHSRMLYLLALINSYCVDYIIRQKISTNVSKFFLDQLPMPRREAGNAYFDAIVPRAAALTCTTAAFAELWESVMGTAWVAADEATALQTIVPTTDPAKRQILRDELDAIIAHLYGLTRDDFAHILGTFPLVFPNNKAGAAKKETLLRVYDQFSQTFQRG